MNVTPEEIDAKLRELQRTNGPKDPQWQPIWLSLIRAVANDAAEVRRFVGKLFPGEVETLVEEDTE